MSESNASGTLPRPEHPRPDFLREPWLNLNGPWEFSFDEPAYDKTIIVPFCYQSEMSGVGLAYEQHDIVYYRRKLNVPAEFRGKRTLLHFGAVDYRCQVWLDGKYLGEHVGGYTPFCFDISELVRPGESREHTLTLRCEDSLDAAQPRGKQSWKGEAFGCWYAPVTGIWQTVWLEAVGKTYIQSAHITPDIDSGRARMEITLNQMPKPGSTLGITITHNGKALNCAAVACTDRSFYVDVAVTDPANFDSAPLWTPNQPNLLDVSLTLSEDKPVDTVMTYFGMRKIEVIGDRLLLNNHNITMKMVLDQGYWKESLLTPPSDDALRLDVEMTKKFGYNGARKHQKVEDPRYYYWADKLGLLVWSELPSAYRFCTQEMQNLSRDMGEMMLRDMNHPCIVAWTPLNESWGVSKILTNAQQQDFSLWLYYMIKSLDPSRLVSNNDGWELTVSDICSVHDYTAYGYQLSQVYDDLDEMTGSTVGGRMLYADGFAYDGEPVLITEYAGIAFAKDATGTNWGYNGVVSTEEDFLDRLKDITDSFREMPYVRGWCLTQLTDVFQEVNGLMDMARNPKVPPETVAEINNPKD